MTRANSDRGERDGHVALVQVIVKDFVLGHGGAIVGKFGFGEDGVTKTGAAGRRRAVVGMRSDGKSFA